jgi:predicted Zn-ribbon and HTH transcriptional regulator
MTKPPTAPQARAQTLRQAIMEALRAGEHDALALSARVGLSEKQVAEHLLHIDRSLRRTGERLRVAPARCIPCGFVFRKRDRLTRPSACPVCGEKRVEAQRFSITGTDPHSPEEDTDPEVP